MAYSQKVVEHYENPRNVGSFEKGDESGAVGFTCGKPAQHGSQSGTPSSLAAAPGSPRPACRTGVGQQSYRPVVSSQPTTPVTRRPRIVW